MQLVEPAGAPARKNRLQALARLALVTLLLVLVSRFMLRSFVDQMLYPAPAVEVPSVPPEGLQDVLLASAVGDQIHGWYAPAENPDWTVLFLHGNGENVATVQMSGLFERFRSLAAAEGLSVAVAAIDYPGYGRSSGRPGEDVNAAAAVATLEFLADRHPDARKLVMGWSLGAAVASQAVPRVEAADGGRSAFDALILASPWHDLPSLAREHFPGFLVRAAVSDDYRSADALLGLGWRGRPLHVVHGTADDLIGVEHGRRLYDRLSANADVSAHWHALQGAGHNDLLGRSATWDVVRTVLTAYQQNPAANESNEG